MAGKKKRDSSFDFDKRIDAVAPDRAEIIGLMERSGRPMKRRDIVAALDIRSDGSLEILRRRLKAMVRDGQLIKNRRSAYGLAHRMDMVAGEVVAHPDGYGFLVPDEGGDDLYLSAKHMRPVLHGDRVLASVIGVDSKGRREGRIREVLERAHEVVVGRYVEESGIALVVPDNPRLTQDVLIPMQDTGGARPGQVVVAEIVRQPGDRQPPLGKIVEVLGRANAPGMAVEIAIRNFSLPWVWPAGVEEEAKAFGEKVDETMTTGRKDLRKLPLVTIDGADARDFDDAVFARRNRNGWSLVVAIADVSSYVKPGSLLDAEAIERGTSVYFPNRVIPMLPEALSNGLCSLKPAVDRLCLACEMTINDQGKVTRSRFVSAVMHSHARLTYEQVWKYLETGELKLRSPVDGVRENLDDLHALYKVLRKARLKRGAIDFESQEVRFAFNEKGVVSELLNVERNDAHKLIEECMILANVEAASYLQKQKIPAPYRVHAPPPELKLDALVEFLRGQGLKPGWKDSPSPRDFERIVEQIHGRPDEKLIMTVLLRSQSLAVYKPENDGHFGLALTAYTHFTSPIRRYPDLLVHRAIHHSLLRGGGEKYLYDSQKMGRLSELCSRYERRAEEASRDVDERLKCSFMERHVGDEFTGIVSGVTSFGLFVELDYGAVSGLVHITGLPNDYYHFDSVRHRLTGERRGLAFQLADRLTVRVSSVNLSDRKIDFELVE